MQEMIAGGESPFILLGERKEGSRTVYELEGMGQRLDYFRSGNLMVWWQSPRRQRTAFWVMRSIITLSGAGFTPGTGNNRHGGIG